MFLLSKFIPRKSRYYYRAVLLILFVLVGLIISTVSIFVSGYFQLNAMHKEFKASAKSTLTYKQNFLDTQTSNFENYIIAVARTPEFEGFLKENPNNDTHEKNHISQIMMAITHADPNIMQFRFLGKNGYEAIRVERDSIGDSPYIVDKNSLQNKGERYYFIETKEIARDKVWFSNVDLNMEHGKIVQPIVPTLRVAKPYYFNGEFRGILIINIFMKNILAEVMESELFHVAIVDKDSHILTNNLKGYDEDEKEWTRYLENSKDIRFTLSNNGDNFLLNLIYHKQHSTLELSKIIKNGEGLKIVLEEKTEELVGHLKAITDYILVMSIIVFVISFPLAFVLSRYPLKLHDKLEKFKDDLKKQLEIVDKYVYMSRTDLDGNIISVSTAFTKLTGYSKDELVGVKHNILKDKDTPSSVYEDMWNNILKGNNWTGILKNVRKNGDLYWVKNHVAPVIQNGQVTGFTAIRENITDQKLIEEISITDELTGAYNRRFFNQIFSKELKRAKRKDDMFCIAMFDIDYFKKYNDTYGHIKGDKALQQVVTAISSKLQRASDYLFRVGGEEFIVIYSEMKSFDEAEHFSSKLVKAVEAIKIEHKSSEISDVLTISLGLLNVTPECDMNEDAILQRIDELLYRAKKAGRNQLVSLEC